MTEMKAYKLWHKKRKEYVKGKRRGMWSRRSHATLAAKYSYFPLEDLEIHEFKLVRADD